MTFCPYCGTKQEPVGGEEPAKEPAAEEPEEAAPEQHDDTGDGTQA